MSLRQEPKSARRMWPFMSSNMLSGFMSLREDREERHETFLLTTQLINKISHSSN